MPEHIRALIVIFGFSFMAFSMVRKTCMLNMTEKDFINRRKAWYVITLVAFLSTNYWLFIVLAGGLVAVFMKRDPNPTALYSVLLFTIPVASKDIPGFGLVNYLFSLSFQLLLSILILGREYLIRRRDGVTFGSVLPDKLLLAYFILLIAVSFRDTTVTDTLRQIVYIFFGIFLPYYVPSRYIRNIAQVREVMMSLVAVLVVQGLIATFEASRHWLLYSAVVNVLGINNGLGGYLARAGVVRAQGVSSHSIVLGYLMVVAISFLVYLLIANRKKWYKSLVLLCLAAGMIAALSRGPWIGMLAFVVTFTMLGRNPILGVFRFAIIGVVALMLASLMPGGQKIIDVLPYIGEVDKGNITYRETLVKKSIIVIQRNLFFGAADFAQAEEFNEIRQAEGFVDFVNTFVGVALESGIIGLSLFCGFFLSILGLIKKHLTRIKNRDSEEYLLGKVLFSTMVSILVMIMTVSSITFIPIIYWLVAGLCVAYFSIKTGSSGAL